MTKLPARGCQLLLRTAVIYLLLVSMATCLAQEMIPRPWMEDAALNDLACTDALHAWAVGDRGVILATQDGGAHWHLQTSGVSANLQSVWFVDPQTGWAAGGKWHPYSHSTQCVLLQTDNGGKTWSRLSPQLPALRQVQFFDKQQGLAWGHGSESEPSGLFATNDGGKHWQSMGDGTRQLWLGGQFIHTASQTRSQNNPGRNSADNRVGIVVGHGGRASQWTSGELRPLNDAPFAGRPLRDVALVPPLDGWLVGDGGLVLRSRDLGYSWQLIPSFTAEQQASRDFHTVAVQDHQIWLAGSPGTHVLHSPDRGKTWQQQPTGISLPIHRLRFVNARQGWAVGGLGTILVTHDGGAHWQLQRQGGSQLALLGLFATAEDLPLLTMAKLACEEGYRVGMHVLFEPRADPKHYGMSLEARLNGGMSPLRLSSTTVSWQFPLPSKRLTLKSWQIAQELNRRHDRRAAEYLVRELVRQIRLWRPLAVLVPSHLPATDGLPEDSSPLNHILQQAVLAALKQAADPTQQVEDSTRLGLPAWQVQRVLGWLPHRHHDFSTLPPRAQLMRVTAEEIAISHHQTLGDLTQRAQGFLDGDHAGWSQKPDTHRDRFPTFDSFVLLAYHQGQPPPRELLDGLSLPPGGPARRDALPVTDQLLAQGKVRDLQNEAQKKRNLRQLLHTGDQQKKPSTSPATSPLHATRQEALFSEVSKQAAQLNPHAQSTILQELAQKHRAHGRLDQAAETLQRLVHLDPQSPLVDSALRWLVSYYASGEVAHLNRHANASPVRQAIAIANANPVVNQLSKHQQIVPSSSDGNLTEEERLDLAVEIAKSVKSPRLAADPAIRWPMGVAQRKRGYIKNTRRTLLTFSHRSHENPWQACAQAEAWLTSPKQAPPYKRIANCQLIAKPPHLDGRLEEPFWQSEPTCLFQEIFPSGGPGELDIAEKDFDVKDPTMGLWIARDQENLYLAIRCAKVPGVQYPSDDRPRTYDSDLSEYDRVRLLLDIDRDYCSYYELVIDSRGWTGESCYGNPHWNPQWFVAPGEEGNTWTAEVAIGWQELVSKPVRSRHAWAIAVERIVPGVELQSWTGPASDEPRPENFGLLLFD